MCAVDLPDAYAMLDGSLDGSEDVARVTGGERTDRAGRGKVRDGGVVRWRRGNCSGRSKVEGSGGEGREVRDGGVVRQKWGGEIEGGG